MNSYERVMSALELKKPDSVPFFLRFSSYGAKYLSISEDEYFSSPDSIVEAQLSMMQRFGTDCIGPFFYASAELEPFLKEELQEGERLSVNHSVVIKGAYDIEELICPDFSKCKSMANILETIEKLSSEVDGKVPIVGAVMAPFSFPAMQMGLERYLLMHYRDVDSFWKLMDINHQFCISWGNAQLRAGADFLLYYDPLQSPEVVSMDKFRRRGYSVTRDTIAKLNGPVCVVLGSAKIGQAAPRIVDCGAKAVMPSWRDNIDSIYGTINNTACVMGGANFRELAKLHKEEVYDKAVSIVENSIEKRGFILADNNDEVSTDISIETLDMICDAFRKAITQN